MEPGPIPTLSPSTSALIRASAASPVAIFPTRRSASISLFILSAKLTISGLCAWATSTAMISAPALSSAMARSRSKGPVAAATINFPSLSLEALGYFLRSSISLMVTIPTILSSFTTGSLSTLFSYAMSRASLGVVDSFMVTTFSVITSSTLLLASEFIMGIMSLLLMIPITFLSFTTGRPFTPSSSMTWFASAIDASGVVVITSLIVRSPEVFTFLTSSTCSLTVIFL